jgi:hypothetical protein
MLWRAVRVMMQEGEKVKVMSTPQISSPYFQQVIETVETLPPDDQVLLIEIIRQRLIQRRRSELISEVAVARQAYHRGDVRRGTVADLMKELVG